MQKQILQEIKELKIALAKLIGTSELPLQEQFSIVALDKAAIEFQKLSIQRGEWVEDHQISSVIKNSPYRVGAFIREEFGFTNFFKRGQTYFYNKKDLFDLGKELKERNVNLSRYLEMREDQIKFKKYLESAKENNGGKRKNKPYNLPIDLKDIVSTPAPTPTAEIILEDIKNLKEEFFQHKLADYIDIYKENYAMVKFVYSFEKYLDPDIKKRSRKWCDNFNYANHALQEVTKKKQKFIPVKEDDMIQL